MNQYAGFGEVLSCQAAARPDAPAFVFLDRNGDVAAERTYSQLDMGARRIAAELTERGLAGVPVVLVFPSGIEFIEALFGCFYAGCIAVPAPYLMARRAGDRTAAICADCRPAAVLTLSRLEGDAEIRGAMLREISDLRFIHTDKLSTSRSIEQPLAVDSSDVALLQYTSGSTGTPRGVMLSHGNLIANSKVIRDAMEHGPDLRGVGWIPLFHDMGLVGHVLQPVYVGVLSVLMSPLTFLQRPLRWLKAVSDWRATTSGGPTYAFDLCSRYVTPEQAAELDLSSWRIAYCGSEPIRPEVLERFAEKFAVSGFRREAIYPCYGLAEATMMVAGPTPGAETRIGSPGSIDRKAESGPAVEPRIPGCGHPRRDHSLVIVDPESGRPVPDGSVGEIWVKGPSVGQGYWRRPQESAAAFDGRLEDGGGGYLRTGDLGFLEDGALFVAGRIKDMIIIRGSNHAPEDIEATMAASHELFGSLPAAAFAIMVEMEEQLVVVQEMKPLVKDPERSMDAAEAAFAGVTHEHGLRLYDLVLVRPGTIPRTSSGKIRRGECRKLYEAGAFQRVDAGFELNFLGRNRAAGGEHLRGESR